VTYSPQEYIAGEITMAKIQLESEKKLLAINLKSYYERLAVILNRANRPDEAGYTSNLSDITSLAARLAEADDHGKKIKLMTEHLETLVRINDRF
jgi:hypothetical protein